MTIQIIINRPDGGQSIITNPPHSEILDILVTPAVIEVIQEPYMVQEGELDGKPIYVEKTRGIKKETSPAVYRKETEEEWLERVATQAVNDLKASFGEGLYTYEIINN